MLKKKKMFDRDLYIESMRQIKTGAIITAVLVTVVAVLLPIGWFINCIQREGAGIVVAAIAKSLFEINVAVPFLVYIMAPVLTLQSFSFLTRRNASDFYHCIPYTRVCLYLTKILAVLTWVVSILVVSSVCGALTVAILPGMTLITSSIPYFFLEFLVMIFAIVCIAALAASLTGTTSSAGFVTVLIIGLPRLLLFIFGQAIFTYLPFIAKESFGILFDASKNLLIGGMTSWLGLLSGQLAEGAFTFPAFFYTLIMGLIYGGLGLLQFCKRKSEAAGNSAANRRIQGVVRMVVAFLVCIPAILEIFFLIKNGQQETTTFISTVYVIFVFYIFAVLAYFIYELITTRRWKNCLRVAPGLLVLAALNLAALLGMHGSVAYYKSSIPKAEDVTYVSMIREQNRFERFVYGGSIQGEDYFISRMNQIRIKDEETIKMLMQQLDFSAEHWEDRYNGSNYEEIKFKVHHKGKDSYYNILLSESQSKEFYTLLSNMKECQDIYMTLPDQKSAKYSLGRWEGEEMPQVDSAVLVEACQKDIEAMGFEAWYKYYNSDDFYRGEPYIVCNLTSGLNRYSLVITISDSMPNLKKAYAKACYTDKKKDELFTLWDDIRAGKYSDTESSEKEMYCDNSLELDNTFYYSGYGSDYGTPEIEEVYDALYTYLKGKDSSYFTNFDGADRCVMLRLTAYKENFSTYESTNKNVFLYIPEDEEVKECMENLRKLMYGESDEEPETEIYVD